MTVFFASWLAINVFVVCLGILQWFRANRAIKRMGRINIHVSHINAQDPDRWLAKLKESSHAE